MTENNQPSSQFLELLAPTTRKNRRNLLIVSLISIAIVFTDLVPKKISSFGIDFDIPNQGALLKITVAINVYLFFAFLFYALPDFCKWMVKYSKEARNTAVNDAKIEEYYKDAHSEGFDIVLDDIADGFNKKIDIFSGISIKVIFIQGFFDFVIPLIIGIFSIYELFIKAFNWNGN